MPNENFVLFAGHLGKDSNTEFTTNGTQVTKFSICSTKKWKQGNEWKEKQVWMNVTAWKNDYAVNLKKGDGVVIIGELDYNVWTDKQNVKHYDNSIIAKSILPIQKVDKSNNQTVDEPPPPDDGDSLPF